jgi:hypothetical protein
VAAEFKVFLFFLKVTIDLDEIPPGPGEPEWFDLVPEGDELSGGRLLLHLAFSRDVGQQEDGGGDTLQVEDDFVMSDELIGARFDEVGRDRSGHSSLQFWPQ